MITVFDIVVDTSRVVGSPTEFVVITEFEIISVIVPIPVVVDTRVVSVPMGS